MTQSLVSGSQNDGPAMREGGPIAKRSGGGGLRILGGEINKSVQNVTSTLTPATFIGSVGIVLLIAIIGSAVPAWAIAHVRPAEVLRTE
jgi:ABC-type antimicrobial peptide transport system permease subunit